MTEGKMQIPRCARNDNFLEDDAMRWCGCEDKRQNRWILLNACIFVAAASKKREPPQDGRNHVRCVAGTTTL